MQASIAFWLLLVCCVVVIGAEPYSENRSSSGERDDGSALVREKGAEARRLHYETKRQPELKGEVHPKLRVRVRLIEVSLTKLQNMGFSWGDAPVLDGSTAQVDGKLKLLENKNIARVLVDEVMVVKDGAETRIRHGVDAPPTETSQQQQGRVQNNFQGTEIVVTTRSEADGQLAIELVCKEVRPIRNSRPTNTKVQDISTVVELPPGQTSVIKGSKDKRVESSVKGVGPGWFPRAAAAFGKVTNNINEIQRFIVLSRDPPLASEPAAAR